MSIKVMTDVWKWSKATATDLLVLLALADIADDQGECWPSIRHLAKKCRIDERTVQRRIRSLEELDEVVVIRGGERRAAPAGLGRTATGSSSTSPKKRRTRVAICRVAICRGVAHTPGRGWRGAGEGVAPVPPEPSIESSVNRHSLAPDDLTVAVAKACGLELDHLTSSARGALGKAVKEIATLVDASVKSESARSTTGRSSRTQTLTPLALAKHWPQLNGSTPEPTLTDAQRFGIAAANRGEGWSEFRGYLVGTTLARRTRQTPRMPTGPAETRRHRTGWKRCRSDASALRYSTPTTDQGPAPSAGGQGQEGEGDQVPSVTDSQAVVTYRAGSDLTAHVRGVDGIYDLERTDGQSTCSCGRAPVCCHVERVELAEADLVAASAVGERRPGA